MTRTTTEHERIIDIFDGIITFSYAYEWQKLQNNALDDLFKLRDLIASHIESETLYLFSTPKEKESFVISILNMLYQAIEDDSCPEAIDFGDVWLNKPHTLSGQYLADKHNEEFNFIVLLVMGTVTNLNCSLPDDIKPFVTIEQVDVMFKNSLEDMPNGFSAPIHKELLVSMIHQYFLKTFAIKNNTFEEGVVVYSELVDRYCENALQQFVKMVEEAVLHDSVINFFAQAKGIDIEIDRYYSWPLICYGPMNYEELLSWYSSLNALDLVQDGRYIGDKNPDNVYLDLKLRRILNHEIGYGQRDIVPKGGIKRYMFDSNLIPILIDGKPLQNHLVMAFPYDKPLSDLQDKLRNYGRYIGNRVNIYGRMYGHALEYGDAVNSANACRKIDTSYKRISLSNVGGILQHICSLLHWQYERSNDYKGKPKKVQSIDVTQLIKKHGFSYTESSIVTVRKSKEKLMLKIVNRFIKP